MPAAAIAAPTKVSYFLIWLVTCRVIMPTMSGGQLLAWTASTFLYVDFSSI